MEVAHCINTVYYETLKPRGERSKIDTSYCQTEFQFILVFLALLLVVVGTSLFLLLILYWIHTLFDLSYRLLFDIFHRGVVALKDILLSCFHSFFIISVKKYLMMTGPCMYQIHLYRVCIFNFHFIPVYEHQIVNIWITKSCTKS